MTSRSRFAPSGAIGLLITIGISFGTQVALAETIIGAGPGAGPSTKVVKKADKPQQQKGKEDGHKGHIEIQSYSLGATQQKGKLELGSLKASSSENSTKPKTPDNVKAPNDQKPAGLLVPAVQKAREAASAKNAGSEKKK